VGGEWLCPLWYVGIEILKASDEKNQDFSVDMEEEIVVKL